MISITAERIHNGHEWLPAGATVELTHEGKITGISYAAAKHTVHYADVLVPGFVNAHCHLELSHMNGVVGKHTGLITFLQTVAQTRNSHSDAEKKIAREAAYNELFKNGVVAVGDIANSTDTIDIRQHEKLHVHTFVESIGFSEENAARSFGYALQTHHAFASQTGNRKSLTQSITPHAPYSVSAALFRLIDEHANGNTISIHNQESEDENSFYRDKTGGVLTLLNALGINYSSFTPTGKTSLMSYLEWLSQSQTVMFVHNTNTKQEDVRFASTHLRKAFWCLCPNANLYIENRLPDVPMLIREGANICIGTDSLASNDELSVLSELRTLKQHFPALSWQDLLSWATYKGAVALQLSDVIGSLEPGKTPGILQITGLDDDLSSINRLY